MIEFKNVTYTYPFQNTPAVKNISFKADYGEIVLCTGASGCGKSTINMLINGLCPHYYGGSLSGSIFVDGIDTAKSSIVELSKNVGSLFQDPEQQFFALNVEDEIAFALEWQGHDHNHIKQKINKTAYEFSISNILHSNVNQLSEGQKQKVGLSSIIVQDIKTIILDEPTANLDVESTYELAKKLKELKANGYSIFIVDHRLYWLKDIVDKVIVLSNGEIVKTGGFDIFEDSEFCFKYGLRNIDILDCRKNLLSSSEAENVCITGSNVSYKWKNGREIFSNYSFTIPYGVTAILGSNGTGKTTLARLLTGLNSTDNGSIEIDGEKVSKKRLLDKSSIVLQNSDFQLYMRSVYEEIYTALKTADNSKSKNELDIEVDNLLRLFGLENLKDRHPQSLSGGEKQRLVIACAVSKNPKILILDEPTSGLDGKNMQRIADILKKQAEKGTAVIVITHDLELLSDVCKYSLNVDDKNNKIIMEAV